MLCRITRRDRSALIASTRTNPNGGSRLQEPLLALAATCHLKVQISQGLGPFFWIGLESCATDGAGVWRGPARETRQIIIIIIIMVIIIIILLILVILIIIIMIIIICSNIKDLDLTGLVGRRHLSEAACLTRPHLFYVCFVVSRTTIMYSCCSPRSKKACVRQVVFDKWLP